MIEHALQKDHVAKPPISLSHAKDQALKKKGLGSFSYWICISYIWVFPKIGVSPNGGFIMENDIKMDDLGGTIIFGNIHIIPQKFICSLAQPPSGFATICSGPI